MRDGVNALENALFEELRNLQATDPKDPDAVKSSIARAKAVEGLAQQITENHNVGRDITAMRMLVRCKECVWGKAVEQVGCVRFEDRGSDGLKDPDGFCAWGVKREDADE